MIFHRARRKQLNDIHICIDINQIEHVVQTKFLDVVINEGLTWKSHILYVNNKIAK